MRDNVNISNIITVLLLNLFPLCLYLNQEKKKHSEKESYIMASITTVIAFIITFVCLKWSQSEIHLPSLLIGSIVGWILSKNLANQNIEMKKFTKFTITIILFFCSSIFQYIPILLFHITEETLTPVVSNYLACFSDIVTALILILMYYDDLKEGIHKCKKNFNEFFDTSFKIWMVGFLGMMASNILINILAPSAVAGNENAVQGMIDISPIVMLLTAGIIAPIIEELTFRKAFQNIIKNPTLFVLISGITFGLLHVIFAYENIIDFLYIIPYSSLGIAFAYMVQKTDNICSSILMHFMHNTAIIGVSILTGMILV